jgi:hypothetical protein
MRWATRLAALVLVLAVICAEVFQLCDGRATVDAYRFVDDQTIALLVDSGPFDWTRVTQVIETSSSVVVEVSSFRPPLPRAGTGDALPLMVHLVSPLGARIVLDESSTVPVPLEPNR